MKDVIMRFLSNPVIYLQIRKHFPKLQPEKVVTIEIYFTIMTKDGCKTVEHVMKNVIYKFQ